MTITPNHVSCSTPMGATLIGGGATFRVWAPRARDVYLVGEFAGKPVWQARADHRLFRDEGGYWGGFRGGVRDGDAYKFWVVGEGSAGYKRDPYARELGSDPPYPNCNCIVRAPDRYAWRSDPWRPPDFSDLVLYQLHVGTFGGQDPARRVGTFLDLTTRLDYLRDLGVNGMQLLPIVEFASPRSLGYDGSDLFSPEMDYTLEGEDARAYLDAVNAQFAHFGKPGVSAAEIETPINQIKILVDLCHLSGIAVFLDVVYNHAGYQIRGQDESIWFFDRAAGTGADDSLYFIDRDHTGPVFAYWKPEVRQFLIDNACFFAQEYHVDGLRYDQTSVIDIEARGSGWLFLRHCTETVRAHHPSTCQVAEYWPRNPFVTEATQAGGGGFDATWNDGLREAARNAIAAAANGSGAHIDLDAVARELMNPGFRDPWRAVNYVESHDEVYRGREPRVARLADGSDPRSWYARSRARVATALVLTAPGIPMLFMGQEILEDKAWSDDPTHHPETLVWWKGLEQGDRSMVDFHRCVRELIALRRNRQVLRQGLARVFHVDRSNRVLAFHRWLEGRGLDVVVVLSLAEQTRRGYRLGLPREGQWREVFNTDVYDHWVNPLVAGNGVEIWTASIPLHGLAQSAELVVPANSVFVLEHRPN